jgi:hypothetical protein
MDITYCKIAGGNFGDDPNMLLWSRLLQCAINCNSTPECNK